MNIISTLWGNVHSIIGRTGIMGRTGLGHGGVKMSETVMSAPTNMRSDSLPAVITIQRFVRQHRTSVDLLATELSCSLASRVYLTHYPTEHLLRFPEFVAKKARPDLKTWTDSNIPPPDRRTRRDIRNFFVNSGVRYEDVVHAGW